MAAVPVPTLSQQEVEGSGPFAPGTDGGSGPCDMAFIADMAGTSSGAPSAGDALAVWLTGPAYDERTGDLGVLPGAPVDGWVAAGGESGAERTFTSGDWEVLTRQSSNGEWLVTQAGCSRSVADGTAPVPVLSQAQVDGTGPFAPPTGGSGPCDVGFVADPVSGFEGEPSAGDALVRWLETPRGDQAADPTVIPAGVPADGWVGEQDPGSGPAQREWQERSFTSGAWRATAVQSSNGSWLVNRLGCTAWEDAAQPSGG
ncbi:hypothetical protein FHN55_13485 [Streptomyces sp. NP160]|uniref:hypothetical protein n=1 Tax=Streptomyces sp. NP160 TaxID=2586637 RepID=UPI001119F8D9|nr:hypothetical protein [Streptomyces sp. NP160]TNM64533.1 hypothetical protein FHN55_13485 [Streptomyces sp. NP160]